MVEVGYKRSIKLIQDSLRNHTDIQPKAVTYFADIMAIFNDKIALLLRKQCQEMGKRTIDVAVAEATLKRIIPEGLFEKVVEGEGRRAIQQWNDGILIYVDKSEQKDAKAREEELRRAGPFVNGVVDMLKNMEPIKVDNKYKMHLSELLMYICARLIRFLANRHARENMESLSVNDIKEAINFEFGPELAEHANAEGVRHVFLFENKYICVPPPPQEIFAFRQKKVLPKLIRRGIREIIEVLGGGRIDDKTNEEVLIVFGNFAREFAKEVRSRSKDNKEMTFTEVEEAAKSYLPPCMADHALAEAYKAVAIANLKGMKK